MFDFDQDQDVRDILNEDIIFDYSDSDCGFENISVQTVKSSSSGNKDKRSTRTSFEQFQKLLLFMQTHADFTKGKTGQTQELDWENLVAELNAMGPAVHSNSEWRIVWSQFKANRKRKAANVKLTAKQLKTNLESTLHSKSNDSCSQSTKGQYSDAESSTSNLEDKLSKTINAGLKDVQSDNFRSEIFKKFDRVVELQMKTMDILIELADIIKSKFDSA